MQNLTLTDPALLFSAISLILLAYTNRFLSYAQLVRALQDKYQTNPDLKAVAQISNLKKRLYLTRSMQILGLLIGVIQAYIFAILSMVYIASALSAEEEHHVHAEVKQESVTA